MDLKKVDTYHRRKKKIRDTIFSVTGKNEVIYGAVAINKQIPKHLQVFTRDIDIATKNPKKEARQTEKELDKLMGFNAFEVVPAKHKGTYKVKSKVTGKTRADYSKLDIPSKKIGKLNYARLRAIKKRLEKVIRERKATHRLAKDIDALNRIKIALKKRK